MRPPPRLLVSLLLCSLLSPVSRAQDWQEKVASLLDGGRYEVALRELRARLDAAPADPAALRLLAEVCENLGKTDDADGAVVA